MYDAFANDYDRFVNWENRLAAEMPFLEAQLKYVHQETGQRRVLDAACGTGMHVIALAQAGYEAAGADLSAGMVERARHNAAQAGIPARFETAGFGSLADVFGTESFDALLCLGNSLPHVHSTEALEEALADFAACLRPGGLLLVQNRNFDAVLAARERWMEPQSHREGSAEWIFMRFYDYEPDGLIQFNVVTLYRPVPGGWQQQVRSTRLLPLQSSTLTSALRSAGFEEILAYGGMSPAPFDAQTSGNLVLSARKQPAG